MIIRKLSEIIGTKDDVHNPKWNSRRLLLKSDGMGFSFHDTLIPAGAELHLHYQNHLESVYCMEGEGQILDLATNETHLLEPGTLYALDQHDKHILTAKSNMRFMCVFNPPLTGAEVHDASGAYPADLS